MGDARAAHPVARVRFGTERTEWPVTHLDRDGFTVTGDPVAPTHPTVATFVIDPTTSIAVRVRGRDRRPWAGHGFDVLGQDSLALMPVVARLTHTRLHPRSPEGPLMPDHAVAPSRSLPVALHVRLAGHAEPLRVVRLDAEGFVLSTCPVAPGVWTTATFEPSTTIRVRVAVTAGDAAAAGHQPFTLAEAADAPLLALVARLTAGARGSIEDVPLATVLPPSVTVLPFVVPTLR